MCKEAGEQTHKLGLTNKTMNKKKKREKDTS